ncbi:WG repeat-containing protein [Flavobacterium sp.]|uniref:WG repeat-containing protein n=1 Tax=Flavobacterium sp. TaxID=239 RepID=UPI0028BEEEC1|nr:WG repeat-containing protein [Flavobacterium sp.]
MKKIYFYITFLVSISASAQVIEVEERGGDYPVEVVAEPGYEYQRTTAGTYREKGKSGFVSADNVRQEAIYDEIRWASDGFIVRQNKLFGIANKKGELTTKIEFDSIGSDSYKTGPGFVVKKNKKYGKISANGEVLLPIAYAKIIGGNLHVTLVKNKKDESQLIFNKQNKSFSKKIEYAALYQNVAIIKADGKFGLLNDKVILPLEYDSIFIPRKNPNYNPIYGNNSKQKIKIQNPLLQTSHTIPYLTVQKKDKFGLIESNGTVIYPTDNDEVLSADSFGYYSVKKNNLCGIYFIGSKDKKKTEIVFDKVFTDGYGAIMASKDKKAGIFTLQGEQIAPFEYDNDFIAQYSGIGYRVAKDKKRGILDRQGKVIVPPIYDDVDTFSLGNRELLNVKQGEKHGVINLQGEIIIPVEFEWIGEENGMFKVVTSEPNRKFGLYDKNGKIIVPVEYNWITDSDTPDSKLTILKAFDGSYNFLNQKNELLFQERIAEYGYILDESNLKNPFASQRNGNHLFIKSKDGKFGLLNESTQQVVFPMIYDEILQFFESRKQLYFSVRKGKKYGLINKDGKEIIPLKYDGISIDFVGYYSEANDNENYSVVVSKGNKMGLVNLNNEIILPFKYDNLQRISRLNELYKAKKGKYYQIIDKNGKPINSSQFDEVANFEYTDSFSGSRINQALTFSNGKMRVIDSDGNFITSETPMQPHKGYKTFDELKWALVKALDSKDDILLKEFVDKIAPSDPILHYLKQNIFDKNSLYTNVELVKEKYFKDLREFKYQEWNPDKRYGYNGYNRKSLTHVTDYTIYDNGIVTNKRADDWAFGDTRFMEKLLRNAVKINGYWISSYFMKRYFDRY